MKSALKWAGSKSKLSPILSEYYQRHLDMGKQAYYVDPFCGSLALPLYLQKHHNLENVYCSDGNEDLIRFWKWVQRKPILQNVCVDSSADTYYKIRNQFNEYRHPYAFYYLNQTGFNGLCRYNRNGKFNVPHGKDSKGNDKKINYMNDFTDIGEFIDEWSFDHCDYTKTLESPYPSAFIYLDPPYMNTFSNYTKEGFTHNDHVNLAELAYIANKEHGCSVVISNASTDETIKLYSEYGFNIEFIKAGRSISCNGDRTKANELIAWKF